MEGKTVIDLTDVDDDNVDNDRNDSNDSNGSIQYLRNKLDSVDLDGEIPNSNANGEQIGSLIDNQSFSRHLYNESQNRNSILHNFYGNDHQIGSLAASRSSIGHVYNGSQNRNWEHQDTSRTVSPESTECVSGTDLTSSLSKSNNITRTPQLNIPSHTIMGRKHSTMPKASASATTRKRPLAEGFEPPTKRSMVRNTHDNVPPRDKHQNRGVDVQEISDDEEEDARTRYQRAVHRVRDIETQLTRNLASANQGGVDDEDHDENDEEDDEGDELEDDALFSTLPVALLSEDDVVITNTITRKPSTTSIKYEELAQVKDTSYTCAPGKCVELQNGSFIRIKKVVQDRTTREIWIIGPLFLRHNEFGDSKWPRRHNELVIMSRIKNGVESELVRKPIKQVKRNRHLILTNQNFPYISVHTHPDSFPVTKENKELGPLFCRWKQTHTVDSSSRVIEESIQRLSADLADPKGHKDPKEIRFQWRGFPTVLGGEYAFNQTQIDDDGSSLVQQRKYVFGDTFCGAGGASCGADEAGFYIKYGVDINEKAIATYRLNFAGKGTTCLRQDIHNFISNAVHNHHTHHYRVDVLHISPPCQPFSPAHTVPNEAKDEMNQAAMFAVGELLKVIKPRVVTVEETYGLFNRHQEWFNALIKMFIDVDYSIRWTGARLEEWGLPQKRRRLLIIAAGPGDTLPCFPAPTHSESNALLKPLSTIHNALLTIPNNTNPTHHNIHAAKFEPGQYKNPYSPHTQAKTITTSGGIGNHHPSGKRRFTIRELAALQKFPASYKFADVNVTELRRQIGNAVPPAVFREIYREIIKTLKKTDGVE